VREIVGDLRTYSYLESTRSPGRTDLRSVLVGIAMRPAAKFLYRTCLLGGWRDGLPGITKILVECVYDSLTWLRYLQAHRRGIGEKTHGGDGAPMLGGGGGVGRHFGRIPAYRGGIRIVAVAHGQTQASAAHNWLQVAAQRGGDVALITDWVPSETCVPVIKIERARPLAILRALVTADVRNPIEALVFSDRRGAAASRLLPRHLRGLVPPATLDADPRLLMDKVVNRRPAHERAS